MKNRYHLFAILIIASGLTACGSDTPSITALNQDFQATQQEAPKTSEELTQIMENIQEKSSIDWSRQQRSALKWTKENGTYSIYDGYRYKGKANTQQIAELKSLLNAENIIASTENNEDHEQLTKTGYENDSFKCAISIFKSEEDLKDIEFNCAE